MYVTKHAYARFKKRQKVKNETEMMRRYDLAITRGTPLIGGSSQPGTLCILFNGYKYIVSEDKSVLITVFPAKRPSNINKRHLLDELRLKQSNKEITLCLATL